MSNIGKIYEWVVPNPGKNYIQLALFITEHQFLAFRFSGEIEFEDNIYYKVGKNPMDWEEL